ncbi:MAG TPA: putative motility protein [Devosiaceae bacterium]|nr:putative motility protein [Devosiaceae bacterium]
MDTSALASSLVSMNAASTQSQIGTAVLKQSLNSEKSVLAILDPSNFKAAPAPGTGVVVDKTA